jgi:hypothetical protein
MRVVATTVVRESIRGKQKTGYIYDIDWEAGSVTRKLPMPEPLYPESDDNPRGGVRGGRGVAATRHGVVVANYDTLHRYDDDWNVLDVLSHPLFVGLHEIDWDGSHLWATATAIDAVLKVSVDGQVDVAWDPHLQPTARHFGLRSRPHPIDGSLDYRRREAPLVDLCHVNGVTRRGDTTIVNCGLVRKPKPHLARLADRVEDRTRRALGMPGGVPKRRRTGRSVVVQLNGSAEPEVLISLEGHDFPTHNGQLIDDRRIGLNDSTHNTLRVFGVADGREQAAIEVPGAWLRGLEPIDSDRLLVGTAPATVALVDLEAKVVEKCMKLSDDPNEAVHGLAVCPPRDERL